MSPEKLCPRCQQPMTVDTKTGFWISACGYKVPETLEEAQARMAARAAAKGSPPPVTITFRGALEARTRSIYEGAHAHLWHDRRADAVRDFKRAAELQPEFTDPYLWLAKLSDDETAKRGYLEEVLARDPGHLEALRLLMVIKGELTAEEAERSLQANDARRVEVTEAVKTETESLTCPVCGGDLTVDTVSGRVVCKFCGYLAPVTETRSAGSGGVVGAALLKRRAQPVQWVIGKRLLHCKACGAERTIPATTLSAVCPFCGQQAVIKQDALTTIEKPDLLIPFTLTEDHARAAIAERLRQADQRLAGLFNENRVAQMELQGVFVPYWVFDALVLVSKTRIDHRTPYSREHVRTFQPYENMQFQDGMVGVLTPALRSPKLLATLTDFELSDAVAYDARRLAANPAALYDIPVADASLTARSTITSAIKAQHEDAIRQQDIEIRVYASVIQMTYTLLLAPVWIATLTERDGDVRTALVSGQTGKVALGKATRQT
ncbi:MAG: TFIIB-type zinc ribbon-containing protein [Anaerolinea sp.]|nr:TFIIB-type zinc ribbon-containing protein [Anaerolinea sp.]